MALRSWRESVERGEEPARAIVLTAVRFTLEELGILHPGRAVEVRVPPAGAVQILPGATHRRGTPPAVVETDARTWLSLACGLLTWDEAVADSRHERSATIPSPGSIRRFAIPRFYAALPPRPRACIPTVLSGTMDTSLPTRGHP